MNFITELVNEIKQEKLNNQLNKCYIFPTRRACAFFRNELQQKFKNNTFFAPKIISIQDCATHLTNMFVADDLYLLLELFKVYTAITNEQFNEKPLTFDVFYPWGQILIKDFDEVDKYIVPAEKIYSTLFELRELEVEYNLNEELVAIISRFREVMSAEQKTELQEKFLEVWRKSYEVYEAFKAVLHNKKIAYEGMIYKEWYAQLQHKDYETEFDEFIFCGFNALSKVEEGIIDSLLTLKKAKIYWDADTFYLQDNKQEAGMFVRKYYAKYPPSKNSRWIVTDKAIYSNTTFELLEVQGGVGQGRVCSQVLYNKQFNGSETALVLCDESHLFPTLYAMPTHVELLNVTMGYPLKLTPLFTLAQTLFDLQLEAKGSNNKTWFRHSSIQGLLNNTYFRSLTAEKGDALQATIIKEKLSWVSLQTIEKELEDEWLVSLFTLTKQPIDLLDRLEQLLLKLFKELNPMDEDLEEDNDVDENLENGVELEIVYHFIKHINLFRSRIKQYDFNFETRHLKKIFLESLIALKIPFSGEPLKGVQLMGFLESRVLDFENLIISGMNEGNIPSSRKQNSFIPYAIRKAYGLPTFEEQDAIYAYHFFRLLQRAKNVTLITDALTASSGVGEPSRFYQQVKAYLKTENITHSHKVINTKVTINKPINLLSIEKTEEVQEILKNFTVTNEVPFEEQRSFSPTALSDYINCPVQFYFKRVVKLKPVKEFEEEIRQIDLGNIVHYTLEDLYLPFVKKEISANEISGILKGDKVSNTIEKILVNENFIGENKELEGKNYLYRSIIEQLVKKVLANDKKSAPFTLLSLEASNFKTMLELDDGTVVRLNGQIDRIDQKDGAIRIIDYKTGTVNFSLRTRNGKPKILLDYMDSYFINPLLKAGFQAYFYAYLFKRSKEAERLKAGIYSLKTLGAGIKFLNDNEFLDNELLDTFEDKLKGLIGEIMTTKVPFMQTSDVKRYEYSDFKEVVGNV